MVGRGVDGRRPVLLLTDPNHARDLDPPAAESSQHLRERLEGLLHLVPVEADERPVIEQAEFVDGRSAAFDQSPLELSPELFEAVNARRHRNLEFVFDLSYLGCQRQRENRAGATGKRRTFP